MKLTKELIESYQRKCISEIEEFLQLSEQEQNLVKISSEYDFYHMNGGTKTMQEYYGWDSVRLRDHQVALVELMNKFGKIFGQKELEVPKVLH